MILDANPGPNHLLKVDSLYAFISVDDEGNEGLCAHYDPNTQTWLAMVAADERTVASLVPIAEEMAQMSKKKIKLVRFKERQELRAF